jgi:hypothetical protein
VLTAGAAGRGGPGGVELVVGESQAGSRSPSAPSV